ncbi:MAG: hypothetical protein N2Z23_01455 [Pyrinomonadaceae bacterium]|nr:hypothetical protein [Pyrinomonadaceae bacterium]MCX7639096.1 hypothetical protein [Pyrinomonadaceae bacterium]MDW8303683.1 hypothetical protein [Acidobacteriota bacterium]
MNFAKDWSSSKKFLFAFAIATFIVSVAVFVISSIPTSEEVERRSLEGAFREGSAEFERLTRKISIANDDENTLESPTALGTIMMSLSGRIRNMTGKSITGLEIKVSVVDSENKPIREKILVVIPTRKEVLLPDEILPVRVTIDGFKPDDDRAMVRWKVTAIKVVE